MFNQSYKILAICLFLIISGCKNDTLARKDAPNDVNKTGDQYRIELVSVAKQLRVGRAKFQVYKRDAGHWVPAAFAPLNFKHIGNELVVEQPETLRTDEQGQVEFNVRFKDPLKYFRWVKPASYPVSATYKVDIKDVLPTFPYQNEGQGWDKADIDSDFLVQLQVAETFYWLPIPYKDIRPVIRQLAGLAHSRKVSSLELFLQDESQRAVTGVDVFLTGTSPVSGELLNDVFTNTEALEFAASVFPGYVQGKEGGYDQTRYSVYPGSYVLDVYRDGKNVLSKEISVEYGVGITRNVLVVE